jgi:Protein of unknown function (DUF1573)
MILRRSPQRNPSTRRSGPRLIQVALGLAAMTCAAAMPWRDAAAPLQQPQPAPPQKPPTSVAPAPVPNSKPPATIPAESLAAPPIRFEPASLEFGTVPPGQRAHGTVLVVNTSDKAIFIQGSRASCTCTSVNLANTVLQPGKSVPLTAEYSGSNMLGPRHVSVRVKVAGFQPFAEVIAQVNVALAVQSDPAYISAYKVKDKEKGTEEVMPQSGVLIITSRDQKPFRILSVQGAPPPFADFDAAKDEPRNQYQLKWDLTKYDPSTCTDPQGVRMPGWLIIETDHPDCPVLDVEVRHECTRHAYLNRGDTWLLEDRRMSVGRIAPGGSGEVTIEVRWLPNASHDDLIRAATSESAQFRADLVEVKPGTDGYDVRLRITPAPEHRGFIYGIVRLQSSRQQWPLTIIGTVRP